MKECIHSSIPQICVHATDIDLRFAKGSVEMKVTMKIFYGDSSKTLMNICWITAFLSGVLTIILCATGGYHLFVSSFDTVAHNHLKIFFMVLFLFITIVFTLVGTAINLIRKDISITLKNL